jgi:hypothetical protein
LLDKQKLQTFVTNVAEQVIGKETVDQDPETIAEEEVEILLAQEVREENPLNEETSLLKWTNWLSKSIISPGNSMGKVHGFPGDRDQDRDQRAVVRHAQDLRGLDTPTLVPNLEIDLGRNPEMDELHRETGNFALVVEATMHGTT